MTVRFQAGRVARAGAAEPDGRGMSLIGRWPPAASRCECNEKGRRRTAGLRSDRAVCRLRRGENPKVLLRPPDKPSAHNGFSQAFFSLTQSSSWFWRKDLFSPTLAQTRRRKTHPGDPAGSGGRPLSAGLHLPLRGRFTAITIRSTASGPCAMAGSPDTKSVPGSSGKTEMRPRPEAMAAS